MTIIIATTQRPDVGLLTGELIVCWMARTSLAEKALLYGQCIFFELL